MERIPHNGQDSVGLGRALEARILELVQAREAVSEARRVKSQFLANVSHEIRTPLNAVVMTTDLLLGTALSAVQLEYAQTLRQAGEDLMRLAGDILDISMIVTGGLVLEKNQVDLRAMVEDVCGRLAPSAEKKGLRFATSVHAEVPAVLFGSHDRLRQILLNLLDNAVKFTESGEIEVDVSIDDMNGDAVRVRIAIRDSGIGIAPEQINVLFRPFSLVDGSTSRRSGGIGLGLAISRGLAELMGGTIDVMSRAGKGSTFSITVMLGRAPGSRSVEVSARATSRRSGHLLDTARRRRAKVLLVEDNPVNQRIGLAVLKKGAFQCQAASGGAEALRMVDRESFDAVLLDCQMPDVDGYEVARRIRERERGTERRLPLIALTAHAVAGERERCLAAGMDDFLTKPIKAEELYATVEAWLDRDPTAVDQRLLDRRRLESPLAGLDRTAALDDHIVPDSAKEKDSGSGLP